MPGDRPSNEVVAATKLIEDHSDRAFKLVALANGLDGAERDDALEAALYAARQITGDPDTRYYALLHVFHGMNARIDVFQDVLGAARNLEATRDQEKAIWTACLVLDQRLRWEVAKSNETDLVRMKLLEHLAFAPLTVDEMLEALKISEMIADNAWRAEAMRRILAQVWHHREDFQNLDPEREMVLSRHLSNFSHYDGEVEVLHQVCQLLSPRNRLQVMVEALAAIDRWNPSMLAMYERTIRSDIQQISHASAVDEELLYSILGRIISSSSRDARNNDKDLLVEHLNNSRRLPTALPEAPSQFWTPRPRGRPKPGAEEVLFQFIRDTYREYFEAGFRNELRAYISSHDSALYQAIGDYERGGRELPADIAMPSRLDLVRERFDRAMRKGLDSLSGPDRQSVVRKLRRDELKS